LIKSINRSIKSIYELERFLDSVYKEFYDQTTLIQVFTGVISKDVIVDIQQSVKLYFPQATLLGATTDGEIVDGEVKKDTITLSVTSFENSSLLDFGLENRDSFISGKRVAKNLIKQNTKVLILFSDGTYTNGEDLLNGIASVSNRVIVSGGMAGDNGEMRGTYVFNQNEIFSKGVVAVSISGDNLFVHNQSNFGWLPFGEKLKVTKADGNVIFSIENTLPTKIYEKYLGKDIANGLPLVGIEFPLIKIDENQKIARAVIGKCDDGTLRFAGNIDEGDIVQIGLGDLDTILNLSKESLLEYINKPVESTFIYSCMARRRFLKENISIEIKPFNKISNNSGFFTNGEFFSIKKGDGTYKYTLLNQTMTILSLAEDLSSVVKRHDVESQINSFDKNLSHTTKAISHFTNVVLKGIEEEVREKRTLAEKLENDIQIEIKKNREKDEILLTEYKLARIGELMGMIAHQWRQPLASISALTSSFRFKLAINKFNLDSEDGQKEFISFIDSTLNKIEGSVGFLSETIDNFRKFYRDNGATEAVSIQDLIEHTLSLVDDRETNFIFDCEDLNMETYSNQLIQVILNIVKNALDVFKERGVKNREIRFLCSNSDEIKYLDIRDNGGGIPDDVLPKIFDKNFSTKSKLDGMGLGLYMSKLIIERCEGRLFAFNTDNGANFRILFKQ
jgi:signal transduction histidine kinase